MKWHEIDLEVRVTKYDVVKTGRIAVSTNCDWSDDKLAAAVVEAARADEAGVTDVQVIRSRQLPAEPSPEDYDKVFDLDRMLGI